ncbi:uncharacterized protein [Anabrus simplex]|uniref:uncharacterized protein n=1 Tax=Anabrus simplex TaxID=316456 RepID=UPI0035A34A96
MNQLILAVTTALLATHYAEARPEQLQPTPHHPPMISQHETVVSVTSSNSTEASGSQETTGDSVESSEDDNITVQAKIAPMCPPRQAEIIEIEKECMMEDKLKDPECTSVAPTTDKDEMEMVNLTTETTTMPEDTTTIPTTESMTMETTVKHVRRHRKRTCNYHLCILRRLDVLDSSDMPDKDLLTTWASTNITDDKQKERTQERLMECIASLKEIFGETGDSSKSSEEETQDETKPEDTLMNRKKKSCTAAKKVIGCLSKSVECPVMKF